MMRIYTRIYSYPITYFDDKWIKNVKKDEEGILLEDQIDSKIFDCLHDYMDEVLQIRKENYYEEYENPMLYQGRLNYVLGNYFPVFDSLEEISKFLIRYFSSEEIHRCFKDIYFLAGYFNQYDIDSFTLENINDKVEERKRYFMDDEEKDKEKTFVGNILDYFMDEQQTKKDPQFLCGLMLEGASHLNPQEEENVFQKVS